MREFDLNFEEFEKEVKSDRLRYTNSFDTMKNSNRLIYYNKNSQGQYGLNEYVYAGYNDDHVNVNCSFIIDYDFTVSPYIKIKDDEFLNFLIECREGKCPKISGLQKDSSIRADAHGRFYIEGPDLYYEDTPATGGSFTNINFDALFLDSFSVIENSELKKRTERDILISDAEHSIIKIVSGNPELLFNFKPRDFEVFVAHMLTEIGFSNVRLSRYCKDGGYDIYAIYCEGDSEYSVVVEVKHYVGHKVGISIVDRINGVRDRLNDDKCMIVTTSSFSSDAINAYRCQNSKVALIDFENIIEILNKSSSQWKVTPLGIWHLPPKEKFGKK